MKSRFINTYHLEGLLYDHDLKIKVSGPNSKNPGIEFINGTIKVATDSEITNIIEVHYSYVVAATKNGGANETFINLKNVLEGKNKTYMAAKGTEDYVPTYVRIDTSIGLNDFYTERNGQEELVSAKRNEGGFLHFIRKEEMKPDMELRNFFRADMVVTSAVRLEADEEKNLAERMRIKGVIFDFRRAILPVEFITYNPQGMDLFENQSPSPSKPFCTEVRGAQISQVITTYEREESAFGPAIVKEIPHNRKEFEITSVFKQVSYPWDDESFITAEELRKAMGDREVYLATVKKNNDEWKAQRQANAAATPSVATTTTTIFKSNPGDFNF